MPNTFNELFKLDPSEKEEPSKEITVDTDYNLIFGNLTVSGGTFIMGNNSPAKYVVGS